MSDVDDLGGSLDIRQLAAAHHAGQLSKSFDLEECLDLVLCVAM